MSGTKEGAKKMVSTIRDKYGDGFYKKIGHLGGGKSHPDTRPFSLSQDLAKRAGAIGGAKSRRKKK